MEGVNMRRMRELLRFVLLFLCVYLGMTLRAQAALQDWLPDSDSWLGKQITKIIEGMKSLTDFIVLKIKEYIDWAIESIVDAVKSLREWFFDVWNKFTEFISNIWNWFKSTLEDWYIWFWETIDWLVNWAVDLWETFWEWIWYIGKWLLDWFFTLLDWMVGLGMDTILWVMDRFPEIKLPGGFEDGIRYFVQYGMILDDFIPFTETLSLFALYMTIYSIVIVYRIVKSFIPGIST